MNIESVLQKIGLSKEQAHIYQTLLQCGPLTLFELAKKSELHRPRLYQVMPSLLELGIATTSLRGKRKIYVAENPELLETIFEKTRSDFTDALSAMKKLYTRDTQKPFLKTLEGTRFSLAVFDDMLNDLSEWEMHYRYSSRPDIQNDVAYKKRRDKGNKKEIQMQSITNTEQYKNLPKSLHHETRMIPTSYDLFEDNISKVIYKDKVAIIDYNSQTSFVITDKKFAEFEKKIFKLLYSRLW